MSEYEEEKEAAVTMRVR